MKRSVVCGGAVLGALQVMYVGSVIGQEVEPIFPIQSPADASSHGLGDLRSVDVPGPDLSAFVIPGKELELAQLGKLFFWDTAVGSDNTACASCHFSAGGDGRTASLSSPGLMRVEDTRNGDILGYHAADGAPDVTYQTKGPDQAIALSDFPLVKNPGEISRNGVIVGPAQGNSNDAMSSPGVIRTLFGDVTPELALEECDPLIDNVFHDGVANTRRVPPRNTPTVINAVFNAFNFWDGRAQPDFNGRNPFGKLDAQARMLFNQAPDGTDSIVETRVDLKNSSLASQAVGPPLSDFEMGCENGAINPRIWQHIGKKLFRSDITGNGGMVALSTQTIHPQDSLIGEYARSGTAGSTIRYRNLVKEVFKPGWWKSEERRILLANAGITATERPAAQAPFIEYPDPVDVAASANELLDPDLVDPDAGDGTERFTLMEMNFPLFFGLAVQAYESQLVADDSPFDRWMRNGSDTGFGSSQLRGLNVFAGQGKCTACHVGPEFTGASVDYFEQGKNLIEPMVMGDGNQALYDAGFYNIGVTPTVEDIGRGGQGPNGVPLGSSRARLAKELNLLSIDVPIIGENHVPAHPEDDPLTEVCNDANGDDRCDLNEPINPDFQRAAVDGAFKVPGLRNVALLGPYFHNGAVASLSQVVEFYDNGGNFCDFNRPDLDADITTLELSSRQKRDLVAFLESLTDDRVRSKKAPFDHPSITIPSRGTHDDLISLPAVSRAGVSGTSRLRPWLVRSHREMGAMPTGFECSSSTGG